MVIREAAHPLNWQITGRGMATKVSGLTSCGQKNITSFIFAKHALQCSLGTYSYMYICKLYMYGLVR
jgi:hypothetical protein